MPWLIDKKNLNNRLQRAKSSSKVNQQENNMECIYPKYNNNNFYRNRQLSNNNQYNLRFQINLKLIYNFKNLSNIKPPKAKLTLKLESTNKYKINY